MTIALLGKASPRLARQVSSSALEFTASNYRFWLKAYVTHLDEDEEELEFAADDEVELHCTSWMGIRPITPFGRAKRGRMIKHQCATK